MDATLSIGVLSARRHLVLPPVFRGRGAAASAGTGQRRRGGVATEGAGGDGAGDAAGVKL